MSAIDSNSDDRDLEALRRAQRAHEPSMEEILASIRNIIADDREPASTAGRTEAPARPVAPAAGPQIVYSKDVCATQTAAPERAAGAQETNPPKVVWLQEGADRDPPEPAAEREVQPLLSPETDEAVTASFGALSANLALRGAELADGMVREMLRPLLKQWLDDNLPGVVERLVRAEIQRIARGPR